MQTPPLTLVIGNKNWSSWSLRPWLAMKKAGLAFEEVHVTLRDGAETRAQCLAHSPSGKVPVLKWGEETVWDSLAILETLADRLPAARLWPEDAQARAHGRAIAAEMHAGFQALRRDMPMDCIHHRPGEGMNEAVAADISRIIALWAEARGRFGEQAGEGQGGPFLLGAFSIADAMYAPVVSRFATYAPDLVALGDRDGVARAYMETVTSMPEMRQWVLEARAQMAAHD
ncbi:glutathione S-transferase family protein [Pyruvatibacter mobilis]|uniref:glutathione S-transferase family protein n=1 Tax=Pyruvatibacter mobilis TaxID=1712261 RepID=UPI003BAA7BBE